MPQSSLSVALITGGAQRIGATIVEYLHSQGLNIALHYRSSEEQAKQLQSRLNARRTDSVILLQADLLQTAALAELVDSAVAHWGRLDVLINNASAFFPTAASRVDETAWERLLNTNLKAPYFLAQHAAAPLRRTTGCIINIVDIHSQRPLKGFPIYSISKAGLAMMTMSLAKELGPEIRVNGVSPGAILWPENEPDEAAKEAIIERTLLKRQGTPEDIAQAVHFLIERADYMSGQILSVDGGRSLHC